MSGLSDETRAKMLSMLKHDINNVLTGVKTGLEIMAMDEFFEDEDNAEDLEDILNASKRLTSMMEDLSLIFADQNHTKGGYPAQTIAELQAHYLTQCEQNRLTPAEKSPPAEGNITLATPMLGRGLLYLTQGLQDAFKKAPSFEFKMHNQSLHIDFRIEEASAEDIKNLLHLNDDSRPAHIMLMTRQALSGLKAKNKVGEGILSLLVPPLS